MSKVRTLLAPSERVETGPTKFGNDLTGVFIRGDDAFGHAMAVKHAVEHVKDPMMQMRLKGLLETLRSSRE